MSPAAWGEAIAGFVVGVGRAVRDRVRARRAAKGTRVRRAWVEQRQGLWYVRRADGMLWTGSGWSHVGSGHATHEQADGVLDALASAGRVSRLPR